MARLKEMLNERGFEEFTSIRNDSSSWYERHVLNDVSRIRAAVGVGEGKGRLLDVGCGPGWLTIGMSFMTDYDFVCVDLSEGAIARAKDNIQKFCRRDRVCALRADAHDLPFDDESFDHVTTTSSIGFWHNPQRGIQELYRVLKPGGCIFIRGFDGNRYTDFWHTLAETGIPEYKIVQGKDMFYILIWKDRQSDGGDLPASTCSAAAWRNAQTELQAAYDALEPGSSLCVGDIGSQYVDFWKTLRDMGLRDFEMLHLRDGEVIEIRKDLDR